MKSIVTFIMGMLVLTSQAFGHAGHGTPGSMPVPPHGGKVVEAKGGKSELFFEAKYAEGKFEIYPLVVGDDKLFQAVPVAEVKPTIKIENPRTKKTQSAKAEAMLADKEQGWTVAFPANGANRLKVHIAAEYKNEKKNAKIDVETK